ncbi:MAG: hypothetical protein KIY10_07725 [Thermoplasmata archaeon]|nr:hypothetical protein [Candidatus Sysuiplasma jiujiangense]
MTVKKLYADRKGVAGAIATMFILLIVLSFINLYMIGYVPVYMKTQEYNHMQQLYGEFSALQIQNYNLESGKWPYPMTATMVLGTPGSAPFASPTNGRVSFSSTSFSASLSYQLKLAHSNVTEYYSINGSLSTNVGNQYYTPQTVAYQGGAVILSQGSVAFVQEGPQLSVTKGSNGASITINLISLIGRDFTVSGDGPVSLTSTYFSNRSVSFGSGEIGDLNLTIHSSYTEAWAKYLKQSFGKLQNVTGIQKFPPTGTGGEYSIEVSSNSIQLSIFNITDLNIEIGYMQITSP